MTSRRPAFAKKRPLSAIFLGNQSLPDNIPDLPEPPILSPSANSTGSGLPSPPASNSTGSGSTGNRSVDGDNSRQRQQMASESPINMHYGNYDKARNASSVSIGSRKSADSDAEDDMDDSEDRDDTARLRRRSTKPVSDNVLALQRVKSLTQRNKMAIDKLSMISRHSPSPSLGSRSNRSPMPLSSSSSTSSHSTTTRRRDLSGSETERESEQLSFAYSSEDDDARPQPSGSSRPTSSLSRQRLLSAPASPEKVLSRSKLANDNGSPGQLNTPRKRVSLAMTNVSDYARDVTSAALAAVASSRRSPTGRRRNPLPQEFTSQAPEPATPRRERLVSDHLGSPSPRSAALPPQTPYSPRINRSGGRPLSTNGRPPTIDLNQSPTRRPRHLSTDLTPNRRSLVGEGLRAAGIVKKITGPEDVFTEETTRRVPRLSVGVDRDLDSPVDAVNRRDNARSRAQQYDPHTPATRASIRPGTSMTDYQRNEPPRTAPPILRTQSSSQAMLETSARDRLLVEAPERYNSPIGSIRRTLRAGTPAPVGAMPSNGLTTEHGKLMLDSLNVFESQLSRLPPMGLTTTATIPEVFRNAQNMVHSMEHLNSLLRSSTNRALEEQIEAEVAGDTDSGAGAELVELWRRVGGEYRESLRVSDELVRTLTGFMLGVGKVLKDASSAANGEAAVQQHLRSVSLDDEYTRRAHLSGDDGSASGGRGSDGRRSTLSKHSWEQDPRPPSATSTRLQYRDEPIMQDPPRRTAPSAYGNLGRGEPNTITLSSIQRRVSNPREMLRQGSGGTQSSSSGSRSIEYPDDALDPSPAPVARYTAAAQASNGRKMEQSAVSPPLPGPPSEDESRPDWNNRRKASTASVLTIRPASNSPAARSGFQPSTAQTPTTAVTPHTVSNNANISKSRSSVAFPHLSRADSSGRQVAFSRPSTVSAAALNGLQQQVARDARQASREDSLTRSGSRTLGHRAAGRASLDSSLPNDNEATTTDRSKRRPSVVGVFR